MGKKRAREEEKDSSQLRSFLRLCDCFPRLSTDTYTLFLFWGAISSLCSGALFFLKTRITSLFLASVLFFAILQMCLFWLLTFILLGEM